MLGTETHSNIRDLGTVAWRNDLAHLESMSGSQWSKILREEKAQMARAAADPAISVRIPAYKEALLAAKKVISSAGWFSIYYRARRGHIKPAIHLSPLSGGSFRWSYAHTDRKMYVAEDIGVDPSGADALEELQVYTITDVGSGSHDYMLTCRSIADGEIWTKDGVGPSVSIADGRVYYLRHKKRLWYNKLCSCDKDTGANERVEYEMKNVRFNLSLVKVDGGFFLLAENNGRSMLFARNDRGKFVQIDKDVSWHIPVLHIPHFVGRMVLTDNGIWEYRFSPRSALDHIHKKYELAAHINEKYGDPYFYCPDFGFMLTRKNGIIYGLRIGVDAWTEEPEELFKIPGGEVVPDLFWLQTNVYSGELKLYVEDPCAGPYLLYLTPSSMEKVFLTRYPEAANYEFNRVKTRSADGTEVYAGYVKLRDHKPQGLLTVIYGAYGSATAMGFIQRKWAPLLENGWVIAYAYVRGGGDNGWYWAEAGRRDQRYRSIEDAEACIGALRRHLHVAAKHTFIYGRSAGGIQVGALANRNPDGRLFKGIYTEVPYVDVLQTTTNPSLPLTELEYDEFGDPRHRLADLSFWARFSPATNVPEGGLPAIFILCRTGLNDTQVYAYEPVKWILRTRGSTPATAVQTSATASPKLLAIEADQGHFYSGPTEIEARALDLAILDAYNSGQIISL